MSNFEATPYPLVFVIVLHTQQSSDTADCLESLMGNNHRNYKVILLDYLSDTHSLVLFQRTYPELQVVSLEENKGYAGNNNIGIQMAQAQGADWIFVLNNDTVMDPSCLSYMIAIGESDPAIGILGPMVYHFDEPNVIQSAGGTLDKYWNGSHSGKDEIDRGQFRSPREVDWISGCAILVRRALIEQVGALDPDYFLYWEETEWCIRARQCRWKVFHVPAAKLWHKGVKRDYQPLPYVTYYMTRNYLMTLSKHRAPWWVSISVIINILRTMLSWSLRPRWRNIRVHRDAMWKGLIDFFRHRIGPMPS